jgi:hypothetical protein
MYDGQLNIDWAIQNSYCFHCEYATQGWQQFCLILIAFQLKVTREIEGNYVSMAFGVHRNKCAGLQLEGAPSGSPPCPIHDMVLDGRLARIAVRVRADSSVVPARDEWCSVWWWVPCSERKPCLSGLAMATPEGVVFLHGGIVIELHPFHTGVLYSR